MKRGQEEEFDLEGFNKIQVEIEIHLIENEVEKKKKGWGWLKIKFNQKSRTLVKYSSHYECWIVGTCMVPML